MPPTRKRDQRKRSRTQSPQSNSERGSKSANTNRTLEKLKRQLRHYERNEKKLKDEIVAEREEFVEYKKRAVWDKMILERKLATSDDEKKNFQKYLEQARADKRDLNLLVRKFQRDNGKPEEQLSAEMAKCLEDFEQELEEMEGFPRRVDQMIETVVNYSTKHAIRAMAIQEKRTFLVRHGERIFALENNIHLLLTKIRVSKKDLIPVPCLESLLSVPFKFWHQRMEKQSRQCQICHEEKLATENTVKCPHCPNSFHKDCIDQWIKTAPESSCPVCEKLIQ